MVKIYLSGQITGDDDYYWKFKKAQEQLEAMGHDVYNPCKFPHKDFENYIECIRLDIAYLSLYCQAVCLLPNWENSKGARFENDVATFLEMPVAPLQQWLDGFGARVTPRKIQHIVTSYDVEQ